MEAVEMASETNPSDEGIVAPDVDPALLLDVKKVAELSGCSPRHVRRMCDEGLMPRPVRLGSLVRWRREDIFEWIAAGCPRIATTKNHRNR